MDFSLFVVSEETHYIFDQVLKIAAMKSHKGGKLAQSFHDVNVSLSDCELKHSNCIENRVMILSRALNTTLLQMSSMHALNSLIPSHLRLHFQCIHLVLFSFIRI